MKTKILTALAAVITFSASAQTNETSVVPAQTNVITLPATSIRAYELNKDNLEVEMLLPATAKLAYSTNIVSGDNSSGCNLCQFDKHGNQLTFPATYPPSNCAPFKAATEKWTVSNVVQTVTITIKWNGKELTHSDTAVLDSVTNRWSLSQDWKANP